MRILVVEDNAALADGISRALEKAGFAVDVLSDGALANEILAYEKFDLVVLDINLPGMDGLQVLSEMRNRGALTQVLILTARDKLEDRVSGLDLGADDYLTKPFDLPELEARVRALLRRNADNKSPEIKCGTLVFDTVARRVFVSGQPLELPKRELSLLEILLTRVGHVVNKEQIADGLANFDDEITPNAIELYVSRLRKRLQPGGIVIKTVRGLGYLLEKQ